ncbi:hypothetical protein RGQ29_003793 [Quercus rubra]|uniref:Pentatricopeptide repeat-containing protein n=1 Tax=Quercus rubra TaxID=3512 RepID=A0AAN7ED32_QUERU|nr:hypothetical protein RGQ29_003793 [Quercus rubra]
MAFIRRCQYSSRCFPFSSVSSNSSSLPKAKATATTTTTTTTTSFNSNSNSIPTLLRACKTSLHLHQLHAHIIRKGLEQDHFLITLLISLSLSLSTLSYSTSVFNRVQRPSTYLWNSLIRAYSQNSHFIHIVSLFVRMKREGGVPDSYTYPSIIKACSTQCEVSLGSALHGSALRCGVEGDLFVKTSLIDFYGKCKHIFSARKLFDDMSDRNVVSWTAMVVGYITVGDLEEAKRLFNEMPQRNVASWNAIICGLVKLGDLKGARRMFDEMPERNVVSYTTMIDGYAKAGDMVSARFLFEQVPQRDIFVWSALISGYAQCGQPNEAVKVFLEMDSRDVKPDEFVMVSLMSACSQIGNLELAKWVDSYVSQSTMDIQQPHLTAALVDMNAKCGNMERATKLFEEMPKKDLISYCSMIQGLSYHGHGNKAVDLFNKMLNEGLVPDEVAFTVILSACSHAGFVEEGWHYFERMRYEYSLVPSPDHYACMVDLLSRVGRLKAAYELLNSMPVEPHAGAWGALLGASADRWSDVSLVREKMKERGVRKITGHSCINS